MARHGGSGPAGTDSGGCVAIIVGLLLAGVIMVSLGFAYYSIGR